MPDKPNKRTKAARKRRFRYYEHPKNEKRDSFQTWKGMPSAEWPGWLDRACRIFFSLLGWVSIFVFGGTVLFFLPYAILPRRGGLGRWFVEQEESWMGWWRFGIGGIIACVFFFRKWRRNWR